MSDDGAIDVKQGVMRSLACLTTIQRLAVSVHTQVI